MLGLGLCAFVGWLIGSFPTAYFLVKRRHGLDIHREGSGNVGANNALRASGSRRTGALVLLGDALKGVTAVVAGWSVPALLLHDFSVGPDSFARAIHPIGDGEMPLAFWTGAFGILGAIAGHNYNPWLSLKARRLVGGKGLATAAGGFLLLLPGLLVAWGLGYGAGLFGFAAWKGVKSSIPGNIAGTLTALAVGWAAYGIGVGLVLTLFALLVLPKHRSQMQTLIHADARHTIRES